MEEDFVARRDRLLAHYGMSLDDLTRYTELFTQFSEADPILIPQTAYDLLTELGLFDIDPRLEKFVRTYSNEPLRAEEFNYSYRYPEYVFVEPAKSVRDTPPANRGPWPPQHPRSPRRQR